jgi:SAM-dependent methyltransferase
VPAFALLVRPAANRVFGGDAASLLACELRTVDRLVLGSTVDDVRTDRIAGVEYVTFSGELDDEARRVVASLSSSFALFERVDGGLLRPVEVSPLDRYDDDLVTTQRYVGKTNETFTRLLVDVAMAAAGTFGGPIRVLDPLCGRGTTLNHALQLGADALGIDVDAKDTHAYATFLKQWLQEKRIKHQVDATAGRKRFRVAIGRKGAAAAEDRQLVDVATADTTDAVALFGRGSVDVVATDLPYGVQHGAQTADASSRNPRDLLAAALPSWRSVLRAGGGMALSWNTRILPRPDVASLIEEAGFELVDPGADVDFTHRVDRTITRDVIVARR